MSVIHSTYINLYIQHYKYIHQFPTSLFAFPITADNQERVSLELWF